MLKEPREANTAGVEGGRGKGEDRLAGAGPREGFRCDFKCDGKTLGGRVPTADTAAAALRDRPE